MNKANSERLKKSTPGWLSQLITCKVKVLEGEIILKQSLRSESSASIFIVDVCRLTVEQRKISSLSDDALVCLERNLPNTLLLCSSERLKL